MSILSEALHLTLYQYLLEHIYSSRITNNIYEKAFFVRMR